MPELMSSRARLVVCVAIVLTLAGCGRRGALETPEQAQQAQPPAASGQSKESGAPAGKPPQRPFVLDAIL